MERTFEVLNRLVEDGIIGEYAVGGAMAALFYAEPAATYDLDIFVVLPRLPSGLITLGPLYDHLSGLGYNVDGECVDIEGVPVQFLPAYNRLVEEGLREARTLMYGEVPVPVLAVEYLIAIAIQTGRSKDRGRVAMLMEETTVDRSRVAEILRSHDLEEKGRQWMK
jgi:hypothetical protein